MKIYQFIKLFIFLIFSSFIIAFRHEAIANLHYFVAALILSFGVESVVVISVVLKKHAVKEIEFCFSFFEIILGLTIATAIRDFSYVCIIWAVWSILRQSIDIYQVFSGKVKGVVAVIYFVQSIIAIVFSILLIINPTEHHALTHIYLVVIELLVISLPPVISELLTSYSKRRKNQ